MQPNGCNLVHGANPKQRVTVLERVVPDEELRVLAGEDVVGDHGHRHLVPKPSAQLKQQPAWTPPSRRLSRGSEWLMPLEFGESGRVMCQRLTNTGGGKREKA